MAATAPADKREDRKQRRRRNARRAATVAAGLSLAVGLIGTFNVIHAPAAHAFCSVFDPCSGGDEGDPGDPGCGWECDPGVGDPVPPPDTSGGQQPGGGGGPTTTNPGTDAHDSKPGYTKARAAMLANPACANLISGSNPAGGVSGYNVLGSVPFITSFTPSPSDTATAKAVASAPVGAGVNGHITFYPVYNSITSANIVTTLAPGAHLSRPLTQEEAQAFTILHEDGHLTGANIAHTNDDPTNATFNLWILNLCFGISVTF